VAGLVTPPPTARRAVTVLAHADHSAGGGDAIGFIGAMVLAGLLAGVYLLAAAGDRRGWSRWRSAVWLAGCAILGVAASPWLDGSAQRHMAQHLMLGMFAPLGLVMGAPVTLLLRTASPPVRRLVVRVLRWRPAAERHPILHLGVHVHYLAAGYLFVWAVAGPDPAPRRPGLRTRALTLLAAAAGHAVLAKFLYAHADVLPPGAAQPAGAVRAAAQLMYYGGDAAELLLAVALFAGWYGRGGRRAGGPATATRRPAIVHDLRRGAEPGRSPRPGRP
jgi:putative membrane protein